MSRRANQILRDLRTAAGLTQVGMAELCGWDRSYVSQLETGAETLGASPALRLADVFRPQMLRLGITVEDLMRGERVQISEATRAAE